VAAEALSAKVEKLARPTPPDLGRTRSVQRLALTKAEAADALGVSVDFFEEHVMSQIRVVRLGRKVLVPVKELERLLDDLAALTLRANDAGFGNR
jgi:excisionase family DNA binding protein